RSAFLQGLLLMNECPDYFKPFYYHLDKWRSAVDAAGMSRTSAALTFVRDTPGIDVVLVGVVAKHQLEECIHDFLVPRGFDGRDLSSNNEQLVKPSELKII